MDFRALECFVAVAEELHFGRAAVRLNITQPSLSSRIKILEGEVGTALLERDRRHVRLTSAGRVFLDHARFAVANTREAVMFARRAAAGETGRLRFGFTGLTSYAGMPELVQQYRLGFPEVDVELIHAETARLEAGMLADEIDIALLHPPLAHEEFAQLEFPPEDLVLAIPVSNPLSSFEKVPISLLADEPLLVGPRRIGPHLYDQIIDLCRTEGGFSPKIAQEVAAMTTLIGLAAAGVGCGFVIRSFDIIKHPGVIYRPLAGRAPHLATSLAWRKDAMSATAKMMLDVAERWLAK